MTTENKVVETSGNTEMSEGYTPAQAQDVVTLAYLQTVVGIAINQTQITPDFITSADTLGTNSIAGTPQTFNIVYVGKPAPTVVLEGYTASEVIPRFNAGAVEFEIPSPVAGTYNLTATLRRGTEDEPGSVYDTLAWTWTVQPAPTDAGIVTGTLGDMTYGEQPVVILALNGTGPFQLSKGDTSSPLPPGTNLLVNRLIGANEAGTTGVFVGAPTQEGPWSNIEIAVTGITGARTTKFFSAGTVVYREPTFVNLATLPTIPFDSAGAINLAPFVRAYPAVASMSATPAVSALHPDLTISALTIQFNGSLTAIAGTLYPITLTLIGNGIGTADSIATAIQVASGTPTPVPPSLGVIASYTSSNFSATDGAEVTLITDAAQGSALALQPAQSTTSQAAARWLSADVSFAFAGSASATTMLVPGLQIGPPPSMIVMRARLGSAIPAGVSRWMDGDNAAQQILIDASATAGPGNAPTFLSAMAVTKSGVARTSDSFLWTASSVRALVVKAWSPTSDDIITTVTVNGTNMTRGAAAVANFQKVWVYFLGAGIPSGPYSFQANLALSTTVPIYYEASGYNASRDVEIVSRFSSAAAVVVGSLTATVVSAGGRLFVSTAVLGADTPDASSISSGPGQVRTNAFNHGSGFYCATFDRQSATTSTNFVFSYQFTNFSVYAIAAIGMAELSQGGGGTRLGFRTGGLSIGWTSAISGLVDTYNSYAFILDSSLSARVVVGVSAGATSTYPVTTTAPLAGDWRSPQLGGTMPAPDWRLRGLRVIRGSLSAVALTNQLTWADSQGTVVTPPPPPPSTSTGAITQAYAGFHTLGAKQMNAYMTFGSHSSNIMLTNGYSYAGLHKKLFNAPAAGGNGSSESAGFLLRDANGEIKPAVRRVDKTVPHLGTTRKAFEWTLWNTQPTWVSNGSVRIHGETTEGGAGGAAPQYTDYVYGRRYFAAFRFMVDASMYDPSFVGLSGLDFALPDIHEDPSQLPPGTSQTAWTLFLDPVAGGLRLSCQLRGHTTLEPALDEPTAAVLQSFQNTTHLITANNIYSVVIEFAHNPFESGGGFPKAIWRYWLEVNDVLQNSGNPLFTRTSRLGYYFSPNKLNFRPPGQGHYAWRGPDQFSGVAADNITNIPSGSKGIRMWSFKGVMVPAGTWGGITTSVNELFNYLRRVE